MDKSIDIIIKERLKTYNVSVPASIDDIINSSSKKLKRSSSMKIIYSRWISVAAILLITITLMNKIYLYKSGNITLDKINKNNVVNNTPNGYIQYEFVDENAKIKGGVTTFKNVNDAEIAANINLYEPSNIPSNVTLSAVDLQYSGDTLLSTLLKYSTSNEDVAFQITQIPTTGKETMLKDLENRIDPNGNHIYEKNVLNNGVLYLATIGENNNAYTGEGFINDTSISISHFSIILSKDDIIKIFSSMK